MQLWSRINIKLIKQKVISNLKLPVTSLLVFFLIHELIAAPTAELVLEFVEFGGLIALHDDTGAVQVQLVGGVVAGQTV